MGSRSVLLLVDMLGVKARWHQGGRRAAQSAFKTLEGIVVNAVKNSENNAPVGGVVETDSAALVFNSLITAIPFAQHLFVSTFCAPKTYRDERLWLRGVVVPYRGNLKFRYRARDSRLPSMIQINRLETSVLIALAAEKAGFRGMRLLVGGGVGTGRAVRNAAADELPGEGGFPRPFLQLRAPPYPKRLAQAHYYDFMWMASRDIARANELNEAMANRLRWASGDPDEFVQAAATQVVFNHWRAFVDSVSGGLGSANSALQPTH